MNDENQRLRIAFLSSMDPQDKRAWSGILFHTADSLQKHCGDVSYISPASLDEQSGKRAFYKKMRILVKRYFAYAPFFSLGRKYFVCNYRIFTAKRFAKSVAPRLKAQSFDVLVAAASTTEMAFVQTDIPIVLIEDATFAALKDYYPQYSGLPKSVVREMTALSNKVIRKASVLIYSSTWAAQSAVEDHHAYPEKVHVVPMGANFEHPPAPERVKQKKRSDQCRLLFIGFDWERKGGDIAFEALLKLEEMGIKAELIVVGCVPPKQFAHARMTVIPFLDKNNPQQYEELEQLYLTSDFFLLPTRNECYGIVFCEANAYGLPVITTQTGGVPVKNGENGFALPLSARGTEYAEIIAKLYQDDQQYAELVRTSRAAYDERLNWDTWGISVTKAIAEMLEQKKSAHVSSASMETIAGL